jgi:nucleotide-binding universal stress UspA family protein
VAGPVECAHVEVPLDGSPFAEIAPPVAAWVGEGADVHVVEVVPCGAEESEGAVRYLDGVCRSRGVAGWNVVEIDDVGAALTDTVGDTPGRLACLATRGRGRNLLLGSVAVSVVERSTRPVVLVGPVARAVTAVEAHRWC